MHITIISLGLSIFKFIGTYRYPSTMEIVISKSDSNHVQFINPSFTDKEELKGIYKLILNGLFQSISDERMM